MDDAVESPSGQHAVTYSLVLPPGWSKIPLREGTAEAVHEIVARAFNEPPEDVPRDQVATLRVEMEGKLRQLAKQAADGAGIDLFLATQLREDTAIPASFVVSEMPLPGSSVEDAETALGALSSTADVQRIMLDEAPGVRGEYVTTPVPEREVRDSSRHVDYILPAPGQPGNWLNVSFSTPGDGDPQGEFADLLVELFDAIMGTFEWTVPAGEPASGSPAGTSEPVTGDR